MFAVILALFLRDIVKIRLLYLYFEIISLIWDFKAECERWITVWRLPT